MDRELVREAVALLSVAIGTIMEDEAYEAVMRLPLIAPPPTAGAIDWAARGATSLRLQMRDKSFSVESGRKTKIESEGRLFCSTCR